MPRLGDEPLSPRVLDQRRTKHEEPLAAGSQQQPTRAGLPQFTLGDLLAFLTGNIEGGLLFPTPEVTSWVERADRYAEPNTVERAQTDSISSVIKYNSDKQREAIELIHRAIKLAHTLRDPDTIFLSAYLGIYFMQTPQQCAERLKLAEEVVSSSRTGVRPVTYAATMMNAAYTFLDVAQRQRAEKALNEIAEFAQSGQVYIRLLLELIESVLSIIDGRFEELEHKVQDVMARGKELGITVIGYARGNRLSVFSYEERLLDTNSPNSS